MSTPPHNDGGPAFPFKCQGPTTAPEIYYGMSLRDWFAGMALQGLVACQNTAGPHIAFAQAAYAFADAMILARSKATNQTPEA